MVYNRVFHSLANFIYVHTNTHTQAVYMGNSSLSISTVSQLLFDKSLFNRISDKIASLNRYKIEYKSHVTHNKINIRIQFDIVCSADRFCLGCIIKSWAKLTLL